MLSMGFPLWKKEKKHKLFTLFYQIRQESKILKYVAAAEAAKTGSYNWRQRKMAARIKTRQDPSSPPTWHSQIPTQLLAWDALPPQVKMP